MSESEDLEDTSSEFEACVHSALASLLHTEQEGQMLTRYLLLYTTIDTDGSELTGFIGSSGMSTIETAGLLHYAVRSNDMSIDDGLRED